jgi:hypothetical protein
MNISKKNRIDLLTDQLKQMQAVLSSLQEQQEDNLVRCKIFVFHFYFYYFENKFIITYFF